MNLYNSMSVANLTTTTTTQRDATTKTWCYFTWTLATTERNIFLHPLPPHPSPLHRLHSTMCITDLGKLKFVQCVSGIIKSLTWFDNWIFGSSQCTLLLRKIWLISKVVKSDSKIIISLLLPKFSPSPWYTLYIFSAYPSGQIGNKKQGLGEDRGTRRPCSIKVQKAGWEPYKISLVLKKVLNSLDLH